MIRAFDLIMLLGVAQPWILSDGMYYNINIIDIMLLYGEKLQKMAEKQTTGPLMPQKGIAERCGCNQKQKGGTKRPPDECLDLDEYFMGIALISSQRSKDSG